MGLGFTQALRSVFDCWSHVFDSVGDVLTPGVKIVRRASALGPSKGKRKKRTVNKPKIQIVKDIDGNDVFGQCSECLTRAPLDASAPAAWMFCPTCNDWTEVER
jgi:hypothetical protein